MIVAEFPYEVRGSRHVMPVVDGNLIGQKGHIFLHKDQAIAQGVKLRKATREEARGFRDRLQEYSRQQRRPDPSLRTFDHQQSVAVAAT